MNKALALVLLTGGIVLLMYGFIEYDSTSSDISRFFTDSPTDKSIWMILGGTVATVLGAFGLSRGVKLA